MAEGWVTYVLVGFGVVVGVVGVIAYLRLVSKTSADDSADGERPSEDEKD
ncbi:hypothetical protein IDH44_19440 [Paenibacillus sp. IB182496]|uniref:Uncharacterized protein n=1 Tax=Paenibacillus sabuli TaxID=2772509 RepID=A0A927GTI6_9BACL|nr:hypothetical protein [Paenibacillus sabuli]MBD2847381.1 hypothetical protein [Paenibacillus sabuli]